MPDPVVDPTTFKTGRLPRTFDPAIPHVSELRRMVAPLPPLPVRLNNAEKLPNFVGMMLNDQLGCCTCAGMAHLIQLWTGNVGTMLTEPDSSVLQAYEEVGGYRPNDMSTDRGANEQDVLRWWQRAGFPSSDGTRVKVGPAFEANPKNLAGLCEVIMEFGAAYIGLEVADGFMEDLPPLWTDKPEYGAPVGGHCVLLHGFDRTDPANPIFDVTTWGTNREYRMDSSFVKKYVDEAYGIVSLLWADLTGKTPYGIDLATLAELGASLGQPVPLEVSGLVDHGALEAAKYGVARSPHWTLVEREVMEKNSTCVACDPNDPVAHAGLQVHHKYVSFHVAKLLGRDDLELDERNLCVLGETEASGVTPNHHLELGHVGNFQRDCNPYVDDDVVTFRGMGTDEIKSDPRWQAHAAAAPPTWGEWTDEMKATKLAWLNEHLPPDPAVVERFGLVVRA